MQPGTYHVLSYDYVADVLERRDPHRPGHLALIESGVATGEILAAGALGNPPHGATIVFAPAAGEAARSFAGRDPYVAAGLVTTWRVDPWTVVAGAG